VDINIGKSTAMQKLTITAIKADMGLILYANEPQ